MMSIRNFDITVMSYPYCDVRIHQNESRVHIERQSGLGLNVPPEILPLLRFPSSLSPNNSKTENVNAI